MSDHFNEEMYRGSSFLTLLLPICLICGGFPISVWAQQGPNDAVAKLGDVVSFTYSDGITKNSDYFSWAKFDPNATFIYAQNWTQPANSAKYSVINNGSFTLIVKAVTVADAATYCFFSTSDVSCANLLVIDSIAATISPSGFPVGYVVNLTCTVEYRGPTTDETNVKPLSQDQVPQLSMYIGSTQITTLSPGEEIIGSDQMTRRKSIFINRTTLTSDVDQYLICKVTTKNPQFNLSSSTPLRVISPTTHADITAIINATTNTNGTCCRVNDILNCTANGFPYPTFVWATADDPYLLPSKSGDGYSSLVITIVGTFTVICSAHNGRSSMWYNDTITFNSFTGVVTTTIPSASSPTVISPLLLFFLVLLYLPRSGSSYFCRVPIH